MADKNKAWIGRSKDGKLLFDFSVLTGQPERPIKLKKNGKPAHSSGRGVRVFKTPQDMENAWEEYKIYCANKYVLTHEFSSKNSEFVSKELRRSITLTIEGFCVWANYSQAMFYESYASNKEFHGIVTRMREECIVDQREKFELGMIPTQLVGLWMSKYGYSAKTPDELQRIKDEYELKKKVLLGEDTDSELIVQVVRKKRSEDE